MSIRVAIVGTGGIARGQHFPSLAALGDRVVIVAVTDTDPASARSAADEFGVPAVYDDLPGLLAAERPDVVVLATPPIAHRAQAIAALDAGAWVISEKPPTLSLAEYDEIAEHEGENGPFVSYIFQHRFGSAAMRLRELIRDGELGRALVAQCNTLWFRPPEYLAVPWRGKWQTEGGGPTMGLGIHQMDLLLSLLGDWSEISAAMATLDRETEMEDVAMATVRFESGAMCSITNSMLSPRESSQVRIDFERGSFELEHLYGYAGDGRRRIPLGPRRERLEQHAPAAVRLGHRRVRAGRAPGSARRGGTPHARARRRDVQVGARAPHRRSSRADARGSVLPVDGGRGSCRRDRRDPREHAARLTRPGVRARRRAAPGSRGGRASRPQALRRRRPRTARS
ncbi:MAG: Gfo/Idh/MocA family protein [Microbacterium gubbeenense]|uniref:Gfo/Idh/MocA family protein n=1 Tax=Microbacterium gubbeenense TaxID=159896 RepID=UPI003F955557